MIEIFVPNQKDKFEEKFKVAIVDGKEQHTGNFRIEPPGIYLGRGCHPLAGKIKERVFPDDIKVNPRRDFVFALSP